MDPNGLALSFFGARLREDLTALLLRDSRHPVFAAEVMPVLLAVHAWEHHIRGCQLVHYLDNEAAQHAYVAACAGTHISNTMVAAYTSWEAKIGFRPWFARVPTSSDIADDPSRLAFSEIQRKGAAPFHIIQDLFA